MSSNAYLLPGDTHLADNVQLMSQGVRSTQRKELAQNQLTQANFNTKYIIALAGLVTITGLAILLGKTISPTVGGLTSLGLLFPIGGMGYVYSCERSALAELTAAAEENTSILTMTRYFKAQKAQQSIRIKSLLLSNRTHSAVPTQPIDERAITHTQLSHSSPMPQQEHLFFGEGRSISYQHPICTHLRYQQYAVSEDQLKTFNFTLKQCLNCVLPDQERHQVKDNQMSIEQILARLRVPMEFLNIEMASDTKSVSVHNIFALISSTKIPKELDSLAQQYTSIEKKLPPISLDQAIACIEFCGLDPLMFSHIPLFPLQINMQYLSCTVNTPSIGYSLYLHSLENWLKLNSPKNLQIFQANVEFSSQSGNDYDLHIANLVVETHAKESAEQRQLCFGYGPSVGVAKSGAALLTIVMFLRLIKMAEQFSPDQIRHLRKAHFDAVLTDPRKEKWQLFENRFKLLPKAQQAATVEFLRSDVRYTPLRQHRLGSCNDARYVLYRQH